VVEEPVISEADADFVQVRGVKGGESRVKVEVSCFGGSLKPKELLDWIREMEKVFD